MLRIECHAVVAVAASDGVAPDHRVGRRVDYSEEILILQVNVHLSGYMVVLRHASFTGEVQSFDDRVGACIDHSLGFAALVRNVDLINGPGRSTSNGFG